jgi:hypothetical protein
MRYLAVQAIDIFAFDGRMDSPMGKMAKCNIVNKTGNLQLAMPAAA